MPFKVSKIYDDNSTNHNAEYQCVNNYRFVMAYEQDPTIITQNRCVRYTPDVVLHKYYMLKLERGAHLSFWNLGLAPNQ